MQVADPLLGVIRTAQLREALTTAGFTYSGVAARLGSQVAAAYGRGDLQAVLEVTGDDRLSTLIRLFLCGQYEPAREVARALAPLSLAAAFNAGIVEPAGPDTIRASIWLHCYRDWRVVADLPETLRPGRPHDDHVIGIGTGPVSLAAATIRTPVRTALDIGTGCGVQALHLSEHADQVTATDLSARALRFAATTAALNGLDWELRLGDLAKPVTGRRFDLVVANLPYVISPGSRSATHLYRDSGRPGDTISAELAATAPDLLADGGHCQFLASWAHVRGQDWTARVSEWLAGTGCDAWVMQHSVTDSVGYITQWLSETGDHTDPALRSAWRDYLRTNNIEAVGVGLIVLRNSRRAAPVIRVEHRARPVPGADISSWFDRQDWLRANDPLTGTYRTADSLQLTQHATRANGWRLDHQTLTLPDGLHSTVEVDPLLVSLVGQCDGTVALHDLLAPLAAEHQMTVDALADDVVPAVIQLVDHGILIPQSP